MLNATRGPFGGTNGSKTDASTTISDSGTRPADTSASGTRTPGTASAAARTDRNGSRRGKSTLGRVAEGASQL